MKRAGGEPRRSTALLWGVLAEIYLGSILYIMGIGSTVMDDAYFGRRASFVVLISITCLVVMGLAAALMIHRISAWLRRAVAIPNFIAAGIVEAMAFTSLVDGSGIFFLLQMAVVGVFVVGWYLSNAETPATSRD